MTQLEVLLLWYAGHKLEEMNKTATFARAAEINAEAKRDLDRFLELKLNEDLHEFEKDCEVNYLINTSMDFGFAEEKPIDELLRDILYHTKVSSIQRKIDILEFKFNAADMTGIRTLVYGKETTIIAIGGTSGDIYAEGWETVQILDWLGLLDILGIKA